MIAPNFQMAVIEAPGCGIDAPPGVLKGQYDKLAPFIPWVCGVCSRVFKPVNYDLPFISYQFDLRVHSWHGRQSVKFGQGGGASTIHVWLCATSSVRIFCTLAEMLTHVRRLI